MSDAVVQAVADAVAGLPRPLEVLGSGELADRLRQRLGATSESQPPATIVEASGTAEGLREAFERVATLGTVVLAGPEPQGPVALDLHDDLHVRGLTLVGLGPPGA